MTRRRPPYDRGRWQLERERMQIPDWEPPIPDRIAPPLASFLPSVLKKMNLADHAQVSQIAADWPEIVGPQLDAVTRPVHVENKLLSVHVRHSGWLMELRGAPTDEILARLQAKYGKTTIRNLRLSVDPGTPPR
jgi:predicted nucleic acid-binding Zn ribbon protein